MSRNRAMDSTAAVPEVCEIGDYVSPAELIALMARMEVGTELFIVDMRDDDRAMGWLRGSTNIPSLEMSPARFEAFARSIAGPAVLCVFHCHFSQVRGPTARRLFERVADSVFPQLGAGVRRPRSTVLRGGWANVSSYALQHGHERVLELPR